MLFDTQTFDEIGGFDENIFYFLKIQILAKEQRKRL